jgi:hypothetical protein
LIVTGRLQAVAKLLEDGFMRLEIRLAIVTLVAGVAAAVLAGRRATEEPVEDNEPMHGMQSAQMAVDTEADAWFV